MNLKEIDRIFAKIKKKGETEGLTYIDYINLQNLLNNIDNNQVKSDDDLKRVYKDIKLLSKKIYYNGILNHFTLKNSKYIEQNAFVLPLVIANMRKGEKHKICSNSYLFICQFHSEKNPSMRVSDIYNFVNCFSCGINLNVIRYLKEYEKLNYKQAVQLLSQIYLFDVERKDSTLEDLEKKYKSALLSDEYLEFLEKGKEKMKIRFGEEFDGTKIEDIYSKRYKTIDRVRNGIYDPNFIYESPKKKIFLNER